jgi:hypothetical protein
MNKKEVDMKKLNDAIIMAKKVLKENPNDTWVQKGLVIMQDELRKNKEDKNG